jgi:nitrite reductase/ring-hydroxylating ferredoxin subunit
MEWLEVCRLDEIAPGCSRRFVAAVPIALFNVDGEILATDDTCTHGQSSLCDGYVDGDVVECAWHMAKFSIRTGKALSLPAVKPLKTYPIRVADGLVFISHSETE